MQKKNLMGEHICRSSLLSTPVCNDAAKAGLSWLVFRQTEAPVLHSPRAEYSYHINWNPRSTELQHADVWRLYYRV